MPESIQLIDQALDFCIKCNICTAACPVAAVTDLFPGPKYVGPQAQRFRDADQPGSPDHSVDYCSGCRVCNEVCPTGVPIAELNARARAQLVRERGLPLRNRLLGRSELLGMLGTPFAPLANWTLSNPPIRWAIERLLGIDRRAPLPRFAGWTLRSWFRRRERAGGRIGGAPPLAREWLGRLARLPASLGLSSRRRSAPPPAGAHQPLPKKVVYFHGCSSNYYEPHVGIAAIEVLERNGCEVVLGQQQCCGLPMLSNGEFDAARRAHRGNLRKLLPWVRRGYAVVGTSTSCTLTLKEEAPELLGWHDDEVRLLAENTYDIFEYLRLLDGEGRFNRLLGRVAGEQPYHPPCQLKAHRIGLPALDILALVPGAEIATSGAACCGIAGTYGLKREKYDIAMAVGAPLFDWVSARQAEATLCDSETCRWQITHATGKPSRHPVELLRDSYRAYAGEKPAQAQGPSS